MNERVHEMNGKAVREDGAYVLYWAQMNRRVDANHALAHAAALANELDRPLLYYEGLTCSYPHANGRLHTFILEGVPETARRLASLGIGYVFYMRRRHRDPNDILYRLAADACAVVTDDYPVFIAAHHNPRVASKLPVAFHAVDASCIVPMRVLEKREYAAYTIRPRIRRLLPKYMRPVAPVQVRRRWECPPPEFHTVVRDEEIAALVASCEIDHSVPPSLTYQGGRLAAEKHLSHFLTHNLSRYAQDRNEPVAHATSNLSPYLHFGQIGALEVALAAQDAADRQGLVPEEFLEELIVRRELAFNHALWARPFDALPALPNWAQATLRTHAADRRDPVYDRDAFCEARTHDPLWNAAQKEMLLRGKIHGYYRMYWGKKIIEWSATCQDALETMISIHDRWALDGRDPNTYTNILWCFGLHDRPWRERPVFGMVRYMSSDGMKRKTHVDAYVREIEHLEMSGKDPFRVV